MSAADVFMTLEGARIGQYSRTVEDVTIDRGPWKWNFGQTPPSCWACGRLPDCGGHLRYRGPGGPGELLTKAQILLTAFMVGLEPLGSDQVHSAPPRAGVGRVAKFDA